MSSLAKYSFLPWLRQGLSSKIIEKDKLGVTPSGSMARERPELTVSIKLNTSEIRKQIKIHGPGDVIGINPDAIMRVHPKPQTRDFESNALAYIEFYEEDFPWRYTPAMHAQDQKRLRPWLALLVLKEGEYEFNNSGNGLPVLTVKSEHARKVFPDHSETWAWAHVHVNHFLSENNLSDKLESELEKNPDVAYSRLICPRKLEKAPEEGERIDYHAFLIPAFETGRLAGLGEDPSDIYAQQSSWKANGQSGSDTRPFNYPVYYNWEFSTGAFGDFETLVSILKAQPLGDRFGKRDMSIEKPGMGLDGLAGTQTLGLEGALKPPEFQSDNWPANTADSAFREKLKDIINASQDLQDSNVAANVANPYFDSSSPQVFYSGNMVDDPVVTPPIYGKWQAMVRKVTSTGGKKWVSELNLDPRNRAAAAVGTRIIIKEQERFMEMAWQQVGEVNEANRKIEEAELAKMVNNSYYEKRLSRMDEDKLLSVSAPALKFVINPVSNKTFESDFTNCKIPNAAKSAAFKKITRPGKKIIRKMNKKAADEGNPVRVQLNILKNFNLDGSGEISTAKKKLNPLMVKDTDIMMDTIQCFLNLQVDGSADQDETLKLDPQAITTQEEYKNDFAAFTSNLEAPLFAKVNDPISDFQAFSSNLFSQINPMVTMKRYIKALVYSGGQIMEEIKPIMAYPEFPQPMFLELQKVSQDFIIPNISEIPENTITLLSNNQKFIEAFMAGLNNEMSRELLWREYPTDQRGSYFRNFWDDKDSMSTGNDHDIMEMHRWNDELGEHNQRFLDEQGHPVQKKDFVVLVIRGDVLKKYPNTLVYAQKAKYDTPKTNPRKLSDSLVEGNIITPVFQAELEPDVALFGFNITAEEARGNINQNKPGWFFVLQERPGHINFGLDDYVDPNPGVNDISIPQSNASSWNELSWGHLVPANGNLNNLHHIPCDFVRSDAGNPDWGTNSAEMAYILYQNPVIFARHAGEMLP